MILEKLETFFQDKMKIVQVNENKFAILFPMFKIEGGRFEIFLIKENDEYYLSDEGSTYKELDEIFKLDEPDVIKNLKAISEIFGCRKRKFSNAFTIECTIENMHIKLSYLIQALSFMLNMKIFYM